MYYVRGLTNRIHDILAIFHLSVVASPLVWRTPNIFVVWSDKEEKSLKAVQRGYVIFFFFQIFAKSRVLNHNG